MFLVCLLNMKPTGGKPRLGSCEIYLWNGWHIYIAFKSAYFHSLLHIALNCLAFPIFCILRVPSLQIWPCLCDYSTSWSLHFGGLLGRRKAEAMKEETHKGNEEGKGRQSNYNMHKLSISSVGNGRKRRDLYVYC